jgi:hypothetical protein
VILQCRYCTSVILYYFGIVDLFTHRCLGANQDDSRQLLQSSLASWYDFIGLSTAVFSRNFQSLAEFKVAFALSAVRQARQHGKGLVSKLPRAKLQNAYIFFELNRLAALVFKGVFQRVQRAGAAQIVRVVDFTVAVIVYSVAAFGDGAA